LITFKKSHVQHIVPIKADFTYEGAIHTSYLNVVVHPIKLEKLELLNSNSFSTLLPNEEKTVKVNAVYSDGTVNDVSSSCIISSSFKNWSYDRNSKFKVQGDVEELGTLEVSYSDSDFSDIEKETLVKYIKLVPDEVISLSTNIVDSVDYTNMSSSENREYQILGIRKSGSTVDLTTTSVISVSNGDGMSFSNGIMTIEPDKLRNSQCISLVISNRETSYKLQKTINVTRRSAYGLNSKDKRIF
jgi:hypothetical protein